MGKLKKKLKRSVSKLVARILISEEVRNALHGLLAKDIAAACEPLSKDIAAACEPLSKDITAVRGSLSKDIAAVREPLAKDIVPLREPLAKDIAALTRTANETLWAEIFRDTISESDWLEHKSFTAGRFAVGYPFLFVLYRALETVKAKSILELGLGQSTKMISQRAKVDGACHVVIEGSRKWYEFFTQNDKTLTDATSVKLLEYAVRPFRDAEEVRVFDGFEQAADGRYDLICVDAPYSGDMKVYSRVDVLTLIPDHLAKSFVILFDDVDRNPEARTCKAIEEAFELHGVAYCTKRYSGKRNLAVYCSPDLELLCTL